MLLFFSDAVFCTTAVVVVGATVTGVAVVAGDDGCSSTLLDLDFFSSIFVGVVVVVVLVAAVVVGLILRFELSIFLILNNGGVGGVV